MLDERKTQLIQCLLGQDDFITIKEMADQFHVGLRTIRYDLDAIDAWLAENGFRVLTRAPRKGVFLEAGEGDKESIQAKLKPSDYYSYVLSPEERQKLVLLNILSENRPVNLIELADKTAVSKTTIANDLDHISKWLKEFHLKLIRRKGYGIYVEGTEENKRNAISTLLKILANPGRQVYSDQSIEKYIESLKEWLPKIDLNFIKTEIERVQERLMIKFSYEGFVSLMSHLALAIERVTLGKDILISKELLHDLMAKEEFAIAKGLSERISQYFNIKMPLDETGYITLHLIGAKLSFVGDQDKYVRKNSQLAYVIDQIISHVERVLGVSFTSRSSLKKDLYIHLMPTIQRLKYNKPLQNPLLSEIVSRYNAVFQACSGARQYLEREFHIKVNDHEVAYIAMHFGAALEAQRPKNNETSNILLVCASGIGTSKLLEANLLSYFRAFHIIDIVSHQDVSRYMDSDEIDLIISTIPIQESKIPVVVVSPLLDQKDIQMLSSYLTANHHFKYNSTGLIMDVMNIIGKHCTIQNYDGLQTEIASLFNNINRLYSPLTSTPQRRILSKENIQLQVECSTWEEAVEKAAQPLLDKGYIEGGYVERIIEKIKRHGPYMVIAPGIAMPHGGIDDGANKTALAIMTLKKTC